ncbi:unnamed protein product [Phytophthora lilii]|uniref:Unnamed protein product n=1 Tax=Phytophthora lilii TaxID=2077276 RepID=A0A9W6XB69_9STRA|nr:unnamed protein product [Phytophthora lilii]
MNDAMVGEDAPDNIEKNVYSDDDDNAEIEEQKRSKLAVAEIYEVYPILADLHIHPLASNARQLTKYYIGKDAKTYRNATMEEEDINTPEQIWQYIGSKRKRDNASDGDSADRTKQRLEDSFLFDNSTSTTSDQTDGKIKLFWIISKNKGLIESNGLRKKIVPILN